jgi:hypothetical protein
MEAVFRPVPDGKHRRLAGIYRKNPDNFRSEYYFRVPGDFWCFPSGYGDFLASFLQDHVAGIFELGISV